jgi:hypothetical protein
MPRVQSTAETLRRVLESTLQDVHTALPGVVRSYDAGTQTAEIELGVQRVRAAEDEDVEEDAPEALPILQGVPVLWPRGGGYFLHWPLTAGDSVGVVFSESDMNAWRESGGVVDPGVGTRHGLSGALALPGLFPRGSTIGSADGTDGRAGKDGGPYIGFKTSTIEVGGATSLVEDPNLDAHLDAVASALDAIAARISAEHGGAVIDPNYGSAARAALLASNPYATSVTKGD